MEYYALTDIGKIREKNQDQAATAINLKDQVLGVVCDGMGAVSYTHLTLPTKLEV